MNAPSRRHFFGLGATSLAGFARSAPPPELAAAIAKLEPYFTPQNDFQDVSRGNPLPHKLPDAKKREVGLHCDTWTLEIVSDPDKPAKLGRELTAKAGTALDFAGLMEMAKTRAVRFAKIMTCLNLGCPLGMGIWEGVPLRDVLWLIRPEANFRRVMYHGYHNDDPKQVFRSSLPPARVFEDPEGLPPVILCYKLNGEFLTSERGGPVRVVVPEAYGFKSVKWVNTITLSNLAHSNDTYATQNNDVESPLKTFAATVRVPDAKAGEAIPVTGYAQVGASGLSKVQVWASAAGKAWPADDPYFTAAPWTDALILGPPAKWPDDAGKPAAWPMKLTRAFWAALLPGLPAGEYTLRCRTIDARKQAQPMPRPFKKTGHNAIEQTKLTVRA